ncbi:MAG: hypothetical protein GX663_09180 [Clostridiales bacterium]|nr:hypothetical protein [Clostridiales bacterium]
MKKTYEKMIIVFLIFFVSTAILLYVDGICFETTGYGGRFASFDLN